MIAEKWDITREDMEAFAVESHERALRASAEGRFEREIVPLGERDASTKARASPNLEKIRSLQARSSRAAASPPRSASQISDASAAMLDRVASRR